MRRTALMLCLALLMVVLAAAAHAAKYSQLPKTGLSYDFASEQKGDWVVGMADDWVCPDGLPITGIRWWGSYWTPPVPGAYTAYSDTLNGAQSGGITSFIIGIVQNVPAGGSMPFDHPDTSLSGILAAWEVPIANANETYAFQVTKSTSPNVVENVYEYYADLTQAVPLLGDAPFQQQQGEKYWLVIGAVSEDINKQWGWHEADGHWGSYATQSVIGFGGQIGWYIPCGGHDMAFELDTVPEPGSLAALALGLAGFVGVIRRRRG